LTTPLRTEEHFSVNETPTMRLHGPLFATSAMRGVFCDRAQLQAMLDVEAALARAGARAGVIPAAAAAAIESKCSAPVYDVDSIAAEAASAGNLAIPLVKALTAQVAAADEAAARFVHWGATSQDVIDTGLVLQLRAALDLLDADAERLADSLAALADAHRATAMAGRTWMQQALPVTLGLKAAGWLDSLTRDRTRLRCLRKNLLVLQLGGATGTLAAFEGRGLSMAGELARDLGLALPDLPWHAQRDRLAECATTLGLLVGSLGKIARDLSLLSQTEIGEMNEPAEPGRGGSSTMPQKRNPVACAVALAAAIRVPPLVATMLAAMVQEQERGLGGWHAEWETLPQILLLTSGSLSQLSHALASPEVHLETIARNLGATRGLNLAGTVAAALTALFGRKAAHQIVAEACRKALDEARPLRDVLAEVAEVREHLSSGELDALFDPTRHLGEAGALIDRALASHLGARKPRDRE
jgi:3-carboxy-cis,cis-muconate cycloisomerase